MLISPAGHFLERIEGRPADMGYVSRRLSNTSSSYTDLQERLDSATGLDGRGAAIVKVRTKATTLARRTAVQFAEVENVRGILERYCDDWEETAVPANNLIEEIETAHASAELLAADAEEAAYRALAFSRAAQTNPDTAASARDANTAANDAAAAQADADLVLAELWQRYDGYYAQWLAAYESALSSLSSARAVLTAEERDVLAQLSAATTAAEVAEIWAAHPEMQDELIAAAPDIVGNLDGIPWDVRADVNEARLQELLRIEPAGSRRDELNAILVALANGVPQPSLVSFDPDADQVLAAVAYGDLTTASQINIMVPGMNSNAGDLPGWGSAAMDLNDDLGAGTATVAWFGYDSPNFIEEPGVERAEAGSVRLGGFLDALGTNNAAAQLAVIAHSYGSTTAALALGSRADNFSVDTFIAVGSAGFPRDPAVLENIRTGPVEVFATISEDDGVARFGRATSADHPVAPERLDDVVVFDSDGGVDADGRDLPASTGHDALGHGAYLEQGSESYENIISILESGEPATERNGPGSATGWWDPANPWISDEYDLIDFDR